MARRKQQSPMAHIVGFFMSVPLVEAQAALNTVSAIVCNREALGLSQLTLPGTVQAATGPVAVPPPKVKRGRKPRQQKLVGGPAPIVGAAAAAGQNPLPPQTVDD